MLFPLKHPHPFLRLLSNDRGGAAVSFILCFPIFLSIVGIVVQFALIANARVVVEHACHAAARAASTSLPDGEPENPRKAACLALAQISPKAQTGAAPEAVSICSAMRDCNTGVAWSFADRYTYAMDATRLDISSQRGNYPSSSEQEIEVTVRYRFRLTVPGANAFLAGGADNVAGVTGRYHTIVATRRIQASPGRRTSAWSDGWPQQ